MLSVKLQKISKKPRIFFKNAQEFFVSKISLSISWFIDSWHSVCWCLNSSVFIIKIACQAANWKKKSQISQCQAICSSSSSIV